MSGSLRNSSYIDNKRHWVILCIIVRRTLYRLSGSFCNLPTVKLQHLAITCISRPSLVVFAQNLPLINMLVLIIIVQWQWIVAELISLNGSMRNWVFPTAFTRRGYEEMLEETEMINWVLSYLKPCRMMDEIKLYIFGLKANCCNLMISEQLLELWTAQTNIMGSTALGQVHELNYTQTGFREELCVRFSIAISISYRSGWNWLFLTGNLFLSYIFKRKYHYCIKISLLHVNKLSRAENRILSTLLLLICFEF